MAKGKYNKKVTINNERDAKYVIENDILYADEVVNAAIEFIAKN